MLLGEIKDWPYEQTTRFLTDVREALRTLETYPELNISWNNSLKWQEISAHSLDLFIQFKPQIKVREIEEAADCRVHHSQLYIAS